eukprot:12738295-Ditylum_brightwellii.AAC.1
MQKYLAKIEAWLEMIEDFVHLPQKLGDEHIMSKVCSSGQIKDRDIQQINYCRMYLNVTTLSDTVLVDGKTLDPHMYNVGDYGKKRCNCGPKQELSPNQLGGGWFQCNRYAQYNPDKENIHLFVNGKDSKWTLTDISAPAHIRTADGMVTIEEADCSGVVGNVQ